MKEETKTKLIEESKKYAALFLVIFLGTYAALSLNNYTRCKCHRRPPIEAPGMQRPPMIPEGNFRGPQGGPPPQIGGPEQQGPQERLGGPQGGPPPQMGERQGQGPDMRGPQGPEQGFQHRGHGPQNVQGQFQKAKK